MRQLPKELQLIAEEELNEIPTRVNSDINCIKKWLQTQSHLTVRKDDQWLLTFLRACKFSLERTKEKLDRYYTMRTIAPEFFGDRDPFLPRIQYAFNDNIIITLPIKVGEPIRTIVRVGASNTDLMEFEDGLKVYFMISDILLHENDNCSIAGTKILLDFKGVNYKHILQVTLPSLKKGMMCLENSYPTRLKSIDMINAPSIVVPLYKAMKLLFSKKLTERFNIYEDNGGTGLYVNFPLSVLPQEYGGESGPMHKLSEKWKIKLESYKDWFQNDMKYCSDEAKRPKDSKLISELYGIDGSFRKLDID